MQVKFSQLSSSRPIKVSMMSTSNNVISSTRMSLMGLSNIIANANREPAITGNLIRFPPLAMSANTGTFSNITYTVQASSQFDGFSPPWRAFNLSNDGNEYWHSAISLYSTTTRLYTGSVQTTTVDSHVIPGEYIQLQTSTPRILKQYTIFPRSSGHVSYIMQRSPITFSMLGSTTSSNGPWFVIDYRSNVQWNSNTAWNSSNNNVNALTFTTRYEAPYMFFRHVTEQVGNVPDTNYQISELVLTANNHALVPKFPSAIMTSNIGTIGGVTYTLTSSGSNIQPFNLFNDEYKNTNQLWSSSNNVFTSGIYVGSNSFNGIAGEWVRMQMNATRQLSHYTIYPRRDTLDNCTSKAPSSFTLFGGSNGANYSIIHTKTAETWSSSNPKTYYVSSPSRFTEFALVVTKVGSNAVLGNSLSFTELQFFGS